MKDKKKEILKSVDVKLDFTLFLVYFIIALVMCGVFGASFGAIGWKLGILYLVLFMPFYLYYFIRIIKVITKLDIYKIVEADFLKIITFGRYVGVRLKFIDEAGRTKEVETRRRLDGFRTASRIANSADKKVKIAYLEDDDQVILISVPKD